MFTFLPVCRIAPCGEDDPRFDPPTRGRWFRWLWISGGNVNICVVVRVYGADMASRPTGDFTDLAHRAIEWLCLNRPEMATYLGDHRYDSRLMDPSPEAAATRVGEVTDLLAEVNAYPDDELDTADSVDRDILRVALESDLHHVTEANEPAWNPMLHNPGNALYLLLSRDFAPFPDRLANLAARLEQIPDYFQAARRRLTEPTHIHTETAISQLDGLLGLLDDAIPQAILEHGVELSAYEAALDLAESATREHQAWLREKLPAAARSPRVGTELFSRKLALALATEWNPERLVEQAWQELDATQAALEETVAKARGIAKPDSTDIASEFERLAQDSSTSATILADCRDAMAEATEFVREHDLITLYGDPVEIIEMPEIDRGVAAAYCRGIGPLETAPLVTQFAVSPTPADWPADRVASFYREYNRHMLHNLTVHEAMPGHVEQLSHSRRYNGRTKLRSVFTSGSFVEGWAVYTEELMVRHGYRAGHSPDAAAALKMQQLKMRLRMVLNTILDISFHTGDLDEARAMELMTTRGYQEAGEAVGKWRRVQLTSTQLCTYYVGYLEVSRLERDLAAARPELSTRARHDAMLSFGSPPARHVRTLLGL